MQSTTGPPACASISSSHTTCTEHPGIPWLTSPSSSTVLSGYILKSPGNTLGHLCVESLGTTFLYTPFKFALLPRCPMCMGHPHLHPLHFQLPWRGVFCVESPGTIAAHVCLSLVILPGHPLHGELWGLQACTHFNLNCPAIVLPAWRDPGPPSLHTA